MRVETGVEFRPAVQEKRVPESDTITKFNKVFYYLRALTRLKEFNAKQMASRDADLPEGFEGGVELPKSARTKRAELYKEARAAHKEGDRERAKAVFQEGNDRLKIARDYLNQGAIKIELPDLGEQIARYVVIRPPEGRISPEDKDKPPIFLIPGISNDLDCEGSLIQELPAAGRTVVSVAFPESYLGGTTEDFAQAVDKAPHFEPHVEFYKKAIEVAASHLGADQLELWGHSTGAEIILEALHDPKIREHVSQAVLLCPGSAADIDLSKKSTMLRAVLNETIRAITSTLHRFPNFTMSVGRIDNQLTKENGDRRERIFTSLLKRVGTKFDSWKGARVKEGGKIIVVSSDKDIMTKSSELYDSKDPERYRSLQATNPQLRVVNIKDGIHMTPILEPDRVIDLVKQAEKT